MTNVYFNLNQREEMARNLWYKRSNTTGNSVSVDSSTDGGTTLDETRGNHAVITLLSPRNHPLWDAIWKHVAMIFAVLVMSIANIGMAWGVDITVTRFALNGTTIYAINESNKMFHDEVEFSLSTTPSLSSNKLTVPASSVLTIGAHGKTITKIVIEWNSANNSSTFSTGTATWKNSNKTMTWTGSTTSLAITSGAASRVNSAVITYTDADPLSGVTTTTLSSFSRIYSSSGACMYSSKTNSAYGVNIQGALDSNNPVGLSKNASNSLFTNGLRLVSPKPISSVVYTWTVAPTAASVSSGTYNSSTSTWTAANTTTTEVTIYNNGTVTAKFSQIVVNFVGSTPECEDVDAPTSLSCTAHTQTSLTFGWTKASDASGYVAKLWDNSSCTGDAVATENIANGNTETVTFSGLTAGTTYYCNVQSKGDGTDFCEDGGTTSAANGTTDACTAISPTWSYPFSTVAVGITIYPTIGGNTGGGAVTYSSSATSKITNDCYATAAGSATLTANVAANGVYCSGSVTSGTITVVADQSGLIKQTLTTGNYEWGTPSAPATTDGTNITSTTVLSATNLTISGNGNTSNGGQTAKITGMTAGSESDNSGKYMQMGFTVKSGKQLNVSAIYIPVQPVSSDVNNIKAVLSDGETTITGTLTNSKNGKLAYIKFDSYGTVKGNVTLTLYAWGWTGGYRLGKSIVIDGEIEDAPSSCTAPSSVTVAATNANGWRYTIGETIDLTCTASGGSGGSYTYQWQKYIGSSWEDIDGATNARFQKASCTSSDGGSYCCVVSTGAGCELASSGYQVYVFTLNGNYYGGDWTEKAITWTGANTGTVTLDLTESSTYMYKVTNNDGKWYGGTSGNFLVLPAARDHYTDQSADIRLFTGPAGNYTFTIDITHFNDYPGTPYVNISVAYPSVSHPAAGYSYFKKWNDWSGYYIHWWYNDGSDHPLSTWGSDPQVTTETTICGTDYIYFPVLDTYNKLIVKDAAGTGSHSTGDLSSTGSSGKYFDFTNDNAWNTFTTYTISFAGNGNTGGSMSSIVGICPDADQVLPANTFEKTGYTFAHWTANVNVKVGGSTITAGNPIAGGSTLQEINSNITLTAQWSPIPVTSITVSPSSKTLDVGGTQQLSVEVLPATALDKAVTWSSSNGSIATVNASGVVTAVAPGSCTITATAHDGSGVTGTCSITVYKIQPTKYSFSVDKTTLCGGETATLTLAGSQSGVTYELREDSSTPIAGTTKIGTGSALTWTGLGAGTYVVYAVADATYTERQMDGSKITVTAATATSITTQPTNQEVTVGEEATLTVVAAGTSLSYQWKESATEGGTYTNVASGGTGSSYSVTPAAAGTKWYKCVVTGTCGEVTTEARKIVANAAADPLVSWTMNIATNATWATTSTSNYGHTEISSIATSHDEGNNAAKNSATAKTAMADEEVTTSVAPTKSANFTFTLASGYKIVPEKITCQVFNVSSGSRTYKAQISDNNGHVYNSTNTLAVSSEATLTPATFNFASDLELKGNITLKVYAWGSGSEFRMGPDIKFYGEIETATCTPVAAPTALTCSAQTSSSLTFTWTKASNASTYTAKLYSDAGCESQVASQDLGDVATVTFSTLSAETTYYCKVQSHGDGSTYCADGGTTSAQSGTTDAACTAHGLAYGIAAVAKNDGDAPFTNTLTNPHSLVVTYSSSNTSAATVNATSGMVTIEGAGETTITATWAGNATYCAGTATYTLTVSSGCTPQSLSKVSATKGTSGTVTGYNDGQYAGDAVVKLYDSSPQSASLPGVGSVDGYKMGDAGSSIVFATLKGTSFQAGDKVRIGITKKNDTRTVDASKDILTIYYGTSKSDATALHTITGVTGAGFYEYTLTAADVTAIGSKKGIGLFRESSNGENPFVYSVEIIGCREWATCTAPDAIAAGSVTGEGATFTITDALNTNNYEIYYSTSSTAPTAETSATVSGISSKSRAVTGLTAETTYYYWVRSNCGGATKSSWVAGTPASFTTEAAAATHSVTYDGNGKTGGSVPTDATAYEEGDVVTVLGNTGSLVKTGETFLGWSTSATASSGTFYPARYKFYMPNEAVTLYAVWGSTAEEKYYYGSITITAGALTPGSTGTKGFFTNNGGEIATSSAISLSSTPGETDYYYESSTLTHTALNKSSNWNTSSTSKRTIRAFKFKSGSSYTLALGSKTATSIMFYGRCGSASRTMTIGGVEYESPSTKDQFFSHEYTKVGNFTGNVTITQDGDFYGILVVTVSTGAGSNHTVTFNMNGKGSAIEPITDVPDGSKIGAPVPSPTAVGAEFGGWYEEAGCSNAWDFATGTITDDKTLFAKWTTCAPSISDQPSGNTYTQYAAATALSVTASGEDLNYQWYTSEDGSADIQGSSAIPGATSASYTPSTSLLGTIYYFCVVSNTCGNAVSTKAAITVNDSKPAPTAVWDIEEPEEGGKGFTFSIEVNKNDGTNWDGELLASMLTLSDNAILDGASIVVNNTNKTIIGTYGVKAGSSSPVTFYLLLPATATQSATRLDHNRTFTPCTGSVSDSYKVRVRKTASHVNNYYYWDNTDGWISPNINNSINSETSGTTMATDFDSIYNTNTQYVWVRTYHANIKKVRIYAQFRAEGMTVSQVYKHTDFFTANDAYIVSYSAEYNGDPAATGTGDANAFEYVDITLTEAMDANDILLVKFNASRVRPLGAVLGATGDGGDQTTNLTWSNSQASGATLEKREDDADFAITAVRDATALKSLGLISYTSSNTAIATVNASTGLVHIADNIDFGSDEYKTTTITATLAASGCYKKKVITYILRVNKHICEDTPGTITYVDHGCSGMDLTLEGYEEGAAIQWYKDGAAISGEISATYNATVAGEYYAVTHKTCDITSTNSITLEAATATAEKIVDSWYVKNGRRTPDIALVQTTGATSFTVTSGDTPVENIGGCTFELKDDGIIYLHGQKEDGSAPSDMTAGDMTITITVSGCSGALSGLDITIHKQAETAKPSVAFVVDGTLRKDGGTATSVSTAKTSERPLWTYLSSSYALTGCNVYWSVDSKELREYYSQYDAILITDDPSTYTKGAGGVEYVKAFGTMVDVRPILTLEAYVGRYSDGGWHVYNADPTSPNPRQVEMKLECKNHDIFKGLDPNASDNVRTTTDEYDNEYWHVIMVDTTVAPYHNTSKDYKDLPALQGFDPHKFDHMLGVGTIADETLQGGVERQEEPAARMMILGIQNEAMAALTNEGKLIIKNAIEYLLKTNMEDVNDCSNYFTDETGDHLWNTAGNWKSGKIPDFESRARILKPVIIPNDCHAIAARVDIATSGKSKWVDGECNGSVTVNPRGALIVGGKIRRADAPHFGIDDLEPTENDDLIVKAEAATDTHYQGALIFDNSDGDTRAVVEMWNPSHWVVDGGTGKKTKYWSYVAVPIQEADIPNFFWYGFTYLYDETSGWIKKGDGTSLYPFQGIGASLQTGNMETFYGPLATTESQDITLTYTAGVGQGMNLIGNSWTAPIQIANFEEDDFGDAAAEVWVFNTGHTNDGHGDGTTTTEGQWSTIPINAPSVPGYEGLKVIPAMQAFEVNTTSETTLHLDYDRLVRAGREKLNEPMRAPRRSAAKQLEATMRVRVSGEVTHTDVYLLKDARFSDAFDNGWDGHYLSGDDRSAKLYAVSEEEGALAFLAQPEIDGTALGFAPSRYGNDYTFTFYYLGEEEYYLNDIKLQQSTLISEEESYFFTFEEGDTNRFYISKTPFNAPSVATGTENTGDGLQKARKILYNNHVYIIRAGKVYGIDGTLVAPNMEQK